MRRYLKKNLPDHRSVSENRCLRPFQDSLLHPRLWHLNRHSVAGAVAAGLFCGLIPGPFQMFFAAFCAVLFRVNLPLAMVVTLYTNPFTLVPIYLAAYQIGRWLLNEGGTFSEPPEIDGLNLLGWLDGLLGWMASAGKPLGLGLFALACVLAFVGYFAVKAAWRIYLLRAIRARHDARRNTR